MILIPIDKDHSKVSLSLIYNGITLHIYLFTLNVKTYGLCLNHSKIYTNKKIILFSLIYHLFSLFSDQCKLLFEPKTLKTDNVFELRKKLFIQKSFFFFKRICQICNMNYKSVVQ